MKGKYISQILTLSIFVTTILYTSCRPTPHKANSHSDGQKKTDSVINETTIEIQDVEIPFMNNDAPMQTLRRESYTSCYNHDTKCPNWVAWALTKESAQGEIEKKIWFDENGYAIGISNFKPEYVKGTYIYDAEAEEPRPEFKDWEQMPTGASHGHMCPVADCKTSKAAINQSFLLTNLCVQAEKLNTGSWNKLEMSCRNWAIKYGRIFIVTGPIFNDNKVSKRMGDIAIPDGFFKVILCMEGTPKAIGFIFPNNNEKHNREESICSVDSVEKITGIDFFPQLPNDIEDLIESESNYKAW